MIDEWHVAIDDVPVGPMRREEVGRRIASGSVGPDSLAWREGLDDWLPVRQIPELAVLMSPTHSMPAPPMPVIPSQRADVAPVGGRAGAAPAFSLDDWAPPTADPGLRELHRSSLDSLPRSSGMPSWGVMFAAACGFAFLMSALTILGARWLSKSEPTAAAPAAPIAPAASPSGEALEPEPEEPPNEMVIELDEIAMDEGPGTKRTTTAKPSTSATTKPKASGSQRTLTDAERAMLARMGGDTQADLGALGGGSSTAERRSGAQSGGLTSDQLKTVVQKNRKNLQRCYETALRGSGSDETVRLDVEVTISPSGNVTSVRGSGSGALPGMKECIERTVKMWRFPNAGESSALKFPVLFQPGA
jgi:hypothetical protein